MSAKSANNRTDVAVVGPLASANDDGMGGDIFSIMRQINGQTFLYAMLYKTTDASVGSFVPQYQFVESGITAYVDTTNSDTSDFQTHYFKWRQHRDLDSVGTANINYYVIDAYPTLTDASNNTKVAGSLYWDCINKILTLSDTPTIFEIDTDAPYSFPGLPSLLTSISYFPPQDPCSGIPNYASTGILTTTDNSTYAGLPTGVDTTTMGTGKENVYFMPFSWYYTSSGTSLAAASANAVFHQCGASSVVSAQTSSAYYTNSCGTKINRGLTSSTLAQQTGGYLPYFPVANAKCGSAWPSTSGDTITYTGLDGVLVTATSTFGLADDGLCGWDSTNTKFVSLGLDAFGPPPDNGKGNPDSDSGGIPWWLFFLILGLIVIIGLVVYISIHLSHGKHKTENTGTGEKPVGQEIEGDKPKTEGVKGK